MNSIKHDEYFEYLTQRSRLGFIYRKYWLYPRLLKYINGKCLDVGCGIGDFVSFRKNTVGVDVNPHLVELCEQKKLNVQHMEPDKLPFPDKSFDSVILDNVLEHIENPEPLLDEINRVLVSKSVFVVGVPGTKGYDQDDDHKVFYSSEKLIKTLGLRGFKVSKAFGMPLELNFLSARLSQYCIYGVFTKL